MRMDTDVAISIWKFISVKVFANLHVIPHIYFFYSFFFSVAQQPAIGPRPPYWVSKSI
jgi:hypothetical protein